MWSGSGVIPAFPTLSLFFLTYNSSEKLPNVKSMNKVVCLGVGTAGLPPLFVKLSHSPK